MLYFLDAGVLILTAAVVYSTVLIMRENEKTRHSLEVFAAKAVVEENAEIVALTYALAVQWRENHYEHCGAELDKSHIETCEKWPLPAAISSTNILTILHREEISV